MKKKIGAIGISVLIFVIVLGTITTIRLTSFGASFFNPVGDTMNSVLQPVEGFFLRSGNAIKGTVHSLFAFKSIQRENEDLHQALEQANGENALLRERILAFERYQTMDGSEFQAVAGGGVIAVDGSEFLAPAWDYYDKIGASVVSRNQNKWYQTLKINKGRQHGVALNAPVVANAGLVGKVISVTETTAEVLLLTDAQGQASSFVRNAHDEAVFGVTYGTYKHGSRLQGDGALLMDFKQEDIVAAGDLVMTSGLGGVFPKGIIIGTVSNVSISASGLMKSARVTPAVNFDGLEEVFVMIYYYP